jgi:hypothetical protein
MGNHFQSLLEIGLRLLQLGLEGFEWPVAKFSEALEDTVQKLVLRHTGRLVLLGFGLGRFDLLLGMLLEVEEATSRYFSKLTTKCPLFVGRRIAALVMSGLISSTYWTFSFGFKA